MEDREAVSQLKLGDMEGLEVLVRRHQGQALNAAFLITGDRSLAEDVVHSAFLRVYERAHQFDGQRPFSPWFLRVVNDAIKAARRRDRHLSLDHRAQDMEVSLADLMPDPGPGPEEMAQQAEVQRAVWEAVQQLSPAQRAVVVQRYYLGLSEAEMAAEGWRSAGTIKRLLHRARSRLRGLLGPMRSDPALGVRDE